MSLPPPGPVSTTDPDAAWTAAKSGPALLAYYDNYLIDTHSRVILGVEATPARFRQESVAARRMLERAKKLGLQPHSLGADKAYGSGEFLAWLLARGVQPHIPVIDRRHQTRGHFTREQFRYEPAEKGRDFFSTGVAEMSRFTVWPCPSSIAAWPLAAQTAAQPRAAALSKRTG